MGKTVKLRHDTSLMPPGWGRKKPNTAEIQLLWKMVCGILFNLPTRMCLNPQRRGLGGDAVWSAIQVEWCWKWVRLHILSLITSDPDCQNVWSNIGPTVWLRHKTTEDPRIPELSVNPGNRKRCWQKNLLSPWTVWNICPWGLRSCMYLWMLKVGRNFPVLLNQGYIHD